MSDSGGSEAGAIALFCILFGVPLVALALVGVPLLAHLAWYVVAWSWGLV